MIVWALGVIGCCVVVLGVRLYLIEKKLRAFFSGTEAKTQEAILFEHTQAIEKLKSTAQTLTEHVDRFDADFLRSVQKVGMVRFNPFSNTGSDQSFSIALLDGENNGFVLSGLYVHQNQMVYAKPIEAGVSTYTLSAEERKALEKAMSPVL